jgi:hypothetical protein
MEVRCGSGCNRDRSSDLLDTSSQKDQDEDARAEGAIVQS